MKSKVLDRPMFRKGDAPENTGIMQGFKDSLAEDDSGYDSGKMLSRTPRSPEILMNNLRGDMRSMDERLNELIDLVGEKAAYQTPPEVLTLLQPILKEQQAAGIAGLQPPPGGPAGAPPGMPPPGAGPMPPPGMPLGMPPMPPPGPEAMGLGALPTAQGPEGAPPMQMAAGGYVQRFANGGYVQNFKDGSDQRGVTPPTSRAFSPQDMQKYAQLQIQSMLNEPAYVDVPDIEKATDKRVELYNKILKRDPEAAKKDKYWALTEAFLNLASNTDPTTGRPMRGGLLSKVGGAFKGTPSKIAAIEGEEGKQQQAIQMLALQGAEKDIETARELNAQLGRQQQSALLRVATAEGMGGGAGSTKMTPYRMQIPGQKPVTVMGSQSGEFFLNGEPIEVPEGASLYTIGAEPRPEKARVPTTKEYVLRNREDASDTIPVQVVDGRPRLLATGQPVPDSLFKTYELQTVPGLGATSVEGLGMTKKEGEALKNASISAMNFMDTADRMYTLLDETPDVNTLVAKGGAILDDVRAEATALAGAMNLRYDSSVFDAGMEYTDDQGTTTSYADKLDSLGIKNRVMQSLIVDLAFQRAATMKQTGQSVSNKDVDRHLMMIGANASNPEAFKSVLGENVRSVFNAYDNMHQVYRGGPVTDPERILGPRFAPMVLGTGEAPLQGDEELQRLEEERQSILREIGEP